MEVALVARQLDVKVSPYNATEYGARIVPVETNQGRKMYKEEQTVLMRRMEHVRKRLFDVHEVFMKLAFKEDLLGGQFSSDKNADGTNTAAPPYVARKRLAKVQTGGLPWRKNIIERWKTRR